MERKLNCVKRGLHLDGCQFELIHISNFSMATISKLFSDRRTQYENFKTELCKHLRALKPFSLHFFSTPVSGIQTWMEDWLPVDTVTILTFGHLARRKYS